ncbi:hypothetical protein P171DRAFT_274191 [Karstenula rhodostoma CBS 690.94]|uniref:Uncharacterized protein n=1 Tax=Karstenula rhodostoma CBS 690.94 TaxID=1392251 RepID=A0A9P4PMF5_9PLEO|nr:hypothetical protein P171DRAFT_274191 [Karstenula rhodostoma CBS 690.94]
MITVHIGATKTSSAPAAKHAHTTRKRRSKRRKVEFRCFDSIYDGTACTHAQAFHSQFQRETHTLPRNPKYSNALNSFGPLRSRVRFVGRKKKVKALTPLLAEGTNIHVSPCPFHMRIAVLPLFYSHFILIFSFSGINFGCDRVVTQSRSWAL